MTIIIMVIITLVNPRKFRGNLCDESRNKDYIIILEMKKKIIYNIVI